jgi:hypothetical protein
MSSVLASIPDASGFDKDVDPVDCIRIQVRTEIMAQRRYQKHANVRFKPNRVYCTPTPRSVTDRKGNSVSFVGDQWNLAMFEKVAREYLDADAGYHTVILEIAQEDVFYGECGATRTKSVTMVFSWDPASPICGFVKKTVEHEYARY